jgi:hypothetical protein
MSCPVAAAGQQVMDVTLCWQAVQSCCCCSSNRRRRLRHFKVALAQFKNMELLRLLQQLYAGLPNG